MATTIDGAWLLAHTALPHVLPLDNEVYTLTVDVDATGSFGGELFSLTGNNSELVIGSHYIRLNGRDIPQRTRGGDRLNAGLSEYEKPAQSIDQLGSNHEWQSPQDSSGSRGTGDTGGRVPNTETTTGITPVQPRGGVTQTGRGGKV